jgi:fibronectin type 3 domain-containing protein
MKSRLLLFKNFTIHVKIGLVIFIALFLIKAIKAQDPCNPTYPIAGLGSAYQQTFVTGGAGVWNTTLCGIASPYHEKVYSFIAPYEATYKIVVMDDPGNDGGGAIYAWLPTTCDQTGWFCIGILQFPGTFGSMYWSPGTYYLLIKQSDGDWNVSTHRFYIICEPNAPILTSTAVSSNQIDLSWNDVEAETGYKIFRSISPGGTYTLIGTTAENITSYSDLGLTAFDDYCYKIKAYNNDAESAYSNESCATTLSNPPTPPLELAAIAGSSGEIDLSWTDAAGETGYKVYRKLNPSGTHSEIATVSQNQTTYPDVGLIQNSEYCYKLKAYNSGGESGFSNEACAMVNPDISTAPANLIATDISANQIDLAWDDVAGETGYKIYRSETLTGTYTQIDIVNANNVNYSNTGLSANSQYCYKVRSFNSSGESGFSSTSCANTCENAPLPPPAPFGLGASAIATGQIYLTWNDVTSEEGYNIYRADIQSGPYVFLACTDSDQPTYLNIDLPANTLYCYKVKAYNTGGESTFSNDACNTTLSIFENSDMMNNSIRIYPNPANDKLNIEIKDYNYKIERLSLLNPLGQTLFNQNGLEPGEHSIVIDLSQYSSGIYYLYLRTDSFVVNKKIIIER